MSATLLLVTLAAVGRPDLTGAVTDPAGKPVAGATVFIYTAAVRAGYSVYCPSCYPDCQKTATTAADGGFRVPALDPELLFRVLVVGDGFAPTFADRVDPAKGPLAVALKPYDPARTGPTHCLRGRVVDEKGKPVVGATLSPNMFKTASRHGFSPGILDPLAVTDRDGRFLLTAKEPIEFAALKVEARGLAAVMTGKLTPDRTDHVVTLQPGAFVSGKVTTAGGKPLAGAALGLEPVSRNADTYLGRYTIAADEHGQFLFSNLPPDRAYHVYGLMGGQKGDAVIPAQTVAVGADGTTADAGPLTPRPGLTLSGRVVLADGKPLPARTRLSVSREAAWDTRTVEPAADGRFEVRGLPPEEVTVFVGVRGYRVSAKNVSRDPANGDRLMGRIDADVRDLLLLLEPGAALRDEDREAGTRWQALKKAPLRGAPADVPSPTR